MEQFSLLYKPDELRNIIREELQSITQLSNKPKSVKEDEYLNIEGAAAFLKVSPHTLRKKAQKSNIPCYKRNGKWLFSKKELTEYIQQGKQFT